MLRRSVRCLCRVYTEDPAARTGRFQEEAYEPRPKMRWPDVGGDPSVKLTLQQQREKYGHAPDFRYGRWQEPVPVARLPSDYMEKEDMYSYGRKGYKMPGLKILKNQPVPEVRALDEYPYIYMFLRGDMDMFTLRQYMEKFAAGKAPDLQQMKAERNFRGRQSRLMAWMAVHPRTKIDWDRSVRGGGGGKKK
eukprot:TRINITY_DN12113_c0_g1_i2.p1 TRINITY_DN12113_c0_g1~~TRINITY_DN12113_c0_g1_i2.p1  ORF type:complete len:192 (+),score=44.77 TRINITY_DN12113_c0_g1_i2:215-790(+)